MSPSRITIAFYVALVFASGTVLGVFGDRAYTAYASSGKYSTTSSKGKDRKAFPSPEEYRKGYINFMKGQLKLTDQQAIQLGLILDETRAKMDEVHKSTIPEQQALRKAQTDKIHAMLTSEQEFQYEKMLKDREEKMKKGGGPRGAPPGF